MTLLSADEAREFPSIGSRPDVPDAVFDVLLGSAEGAIEAELGGPTGTVTEVIDGRLLSFVTLRRRALSITSIATTQDTIETTLAEDDWRLAYDARTIWRLGGGSNPGALWPMALGGFVTVEYETADDEADRKRVQAALVALDLNTAPGLTMEQIGSWLEQRASSVDYSKERNAILASLWPAATFGDFA